MQRKLKIIGSSKNLVEQHAAKKYKLRALGLPLPLRSFAPLNDCIYARVSIVGMRLRRINRPKAALITAKSVF